MLNLIIPTVENIDNTKGAVIVYFINQKTTFLINSSVIYKVINYETEKDDNGTFSSNLRGDILTSNKFKNDYLKHKLTIRLLADLGEETLLSLKNTLRTIKINDKKNDFYNWTKIEKFEELDFMSYRKILSQIIKSKKHPKINKILKDYNLKKFTSTFYKFIIERNKYTHGEFLFYFKEKIFVLKYYNSDIKNYEYAKIDSLIFNSYSKTFDVFDEVLSKIQKSYIN